jgi:hypothetical protein
MSAERGERARRDGFAGSCYRAPVWSVAGRARRGRPCRWPAPVGGKVGAAWHQADEYWTMANALIGGLAGEFVIHGLLAGVCRRPAKSKTFAGKAGRGEAQPVVSASHTRKATPEFGSAKNEYGIRTTGRVETASAIERPPLNRTARLAERVNCSTGSTVKGSSGPPGDCRLAGSLLSSAATSRQPIATRAVRMKRRNGSSGVGGPQLAARCGIWSP